MSYESTKTSNNLSGSETMASDMSSQSNNTNFYTNNPTRSQTMMMNPMMTGGNYYNGPPPSAASQAGQAPGPGTPAQQAQMANRPMYQSYPPSAAPPHHSQSQQQPTQHHQILSPFDTYDSRSTGYYSMYPHDAAVYEHQQPSSIGRNYYGTYGENHLESSPYPSKDGSMSSAANNNHDMNATESTTTSHDQHQMQAGSMPMATGPTATGNGGYNNPSMMPPPHPASKQQNYPNYPPQQTPGDMYSRTSNNAAGSQYMPQYSPYPNPGAPMMNPRSPAPNSNVYRAPYSSGAPYQNGIGSPSATSGKSATRPQQVSPKHSSTQPTTPPQQPRYPNPYPNYTNGPIAYKPGGPNGYAPPLQQPQPSAQGQPAQQQQVPGQSWPPTTNQRDVVTPSLASSTGDSDSNSSSASQQTMPSYPPPPPMTNGPSGPGYPPHVSNPYNPTGMNDSNNNSMNSTGHPYMDQSYSNIPPPNYGYPPQTMNAYGGHPQQAPPNMHGPPPSTDFRPPNTQSMDDENNPYRNKTPSGMMTDGQQQQQHPSSLSQSQSVSSSTNGPKSPSGTSMSSYVPDDGESSNSSFPDSPPPSHEKGQSKRKLSSTTSNTHNTPAEVFSKLREMGDESERQERQIFVDRLQKLWEEHQVVCRNLPSISKQTIDLYRLYTCVREQNGFQEFSKVAKNRHWRDIASKLNIPNSSSAAFNVKQKYINLKLFHYECKYDRGGINPEPILAEIDKQQGKRAKTPKKGGSNSGSTANNTNEGSNDGRPSSSHTPSSNTPLTVQQQQQASQQPQQGPPPVQNPAVQDPYRGGYHAPAPGQGHPHPHPMGHPPGVYRPMQMPMHPYGPTGNEMQAPYDPSVGGQMMYNNPEMDYQRAGYPPPGQQQGPPAQMMKGPGNPYGMAPPGTQGAAAPPGGMPGQHRPPGPYPSIATKPQQHQHQQQQQPQQQQQMVPPTQADYGVPPQSSTMPGAPPNQQTSNAPPVQQTYHYPPQQNMPSAYPPPPPAGYPQQRAPAMVGPPAPSAQAPAHDPYMSQQVPPNQTYPTPTPMNYPYKKVEMSTPDPSNAESQDPHKGNKLLMSQLRSAPSNTSTLPTSSPMSILTSSSTGASPMVNASVTPSAVPSAPFPANSVEATTIPLKTKRKKLTAKDVTPVDPWKLMMSLRGGLLAETTWALDTINVMLADDQTHSHFRLKQMPGLLQAIVDIYLKCLTELFDEFKSSPSNIENQQPSLDELNGSSHLTCTTIKNKQSSVSKIDQSIAYRVESNYLNRYRRKYVKQQSIVYDQVSDEQGNDKRNPMNILDLQNTDDLCYIRTHFDPLRSDDSFYEKLYYGHRPDESSPSLTSDENVREPMKKCPTSSRKRVKTPEGDLSMDDTDADAALVEDEEDDPNTNHSKRRRLHSDPMREISDSNKEFLERYKRKFEYDERTSYELYPGFSFSSSLAKSTTNPKGMEIDSCSNSSEPQENASALFTYHSVAFDQICARCTCVSSILRNLSFIVGNEIELVKSKTLIGLLARLLLLRHGIHHNDQSDTHSSHEETVNSDQVKDEKTFSSSSASFSWTECVMNVRENTLVTLANIAGALVLDTFDSDLLFTLIDGLLHWSTCYSGEAIDSLHSSLISAQRLAIEILTKLSVHEMNMDFILATPPFYRIVSLFHVLTDWLIVDDVNGGISNWHPPGSTHYHSNFPRPQSHTQREFAIVLLNALTRCDPLAANVIARIPYAISLLINFLEDYEIKTNELMARYGPEYVIRLTTQPSNAQHAEQILFTTGDMLKRAATCLLSIVSYTDNVKMMKRYEDRILNLSISHVIDSSVGRVLTDVLHYCSLHNS